MQLRWRLLRHKNTTFALCTQLHMLHFCDIHKSRVNMKVYLYEIFKNLLHVDAMFRTYFMHSRQIFGCPCPITSVTISIIPLSHSKLP